MEQLGLMYYYVKSMNMTFKNILPTFKNIIFILKLWGGVSSFGRFKVAKQLWSFVSTGKNLERLKESLL